MQTEQSRYRSKSLFTGNLYKNYQWFYENFYKNISLATQEFLSSDVELKLVSVSEKDNILFSGEEYFVTKIRITKELNILLRISKTAIRSILAVILGENDSPFNLEELTELEAKILTSYNDFVYKSFVDNLVDLKNSPKKVKHNYDYHLTFFIKANGQELGKFIVSVPDCALPEISQHELPYNFSIDDFPKTKVAVDLKVGTTKISLNDVRNIEVDDIVVLENSNINKMVITVGNTRKAFKLTPDPSLIVDFGGDDEEDDDGGHYMEENNTKSQNMWDTIQVDISAEFEQVKIPLGDLRQISEGLVVDIGSVYENKIDLKVENKIIASGELVIINDRYGVRVDSVYNSDSETSQGTSQAPAIEEVEEPRVMEEDFNEDDFDYSNFEIEDENI